MHAYCSTAFTTLGKFRLARFHLVDIGTVTCDLGGTRPMFLLLNILVEYRLTVQYQYQRLRDSASPVSVC